MKIAIDKNVVEFEFFRFMKSFTNEFDNRDDELMCDYVDKLRHEIANVNNVYFDAIRRENAHKHANETIFVVIECETQNEFVVFFNHEFNYVTNAFRV